MELRKLDNLSLIEKVKKLEDTFCVFDNREIIEPNYIIPEHQQLDWSLLDKSGTPEEKEQYKQQLEQRCQELLDKGLIKDYHSFFNVERNLSPEQSECIKEYANKIINNIGLIQDKDYKIDDNGKITIIGFSSVESIESLKEVKQKLEEVFNNSEESIRDFIEAKALSPKQQYELLQSEKRNKESIKQAIEQIDNKITQQQEEQKDNKQKQCEQYDELNLKTPTFIHEEEQKKSAISEKQEEKKQGRTIISWRKLENGEETTEVKELDVQTGAEKITLLSKKISDVGIQLQNPTTT
ncbi:MAG: hypothetical protein LBC92_00185 [Rickettsiales bacterium]|nr:hypothetical protein [Rickettsiales bacterium]